MASGQAAARIAKEVPRAARTLLASFRRLDWFEGAAPKVAKRYFKGVPPKFRFSNPADAHAGLKKLWESVSGVLTRDEHDLLGAIVEQIGNGGKKLSPDEGRNLRDVIQSLIRRKATAVGKLTAVSTELKSTGPIDTVIDGSVKRIVEILERELLNSGSIIGFPRAIARTLHKMNPNLIPEKWSWMVTDEGVQKHVSGKVLNNDFRGLIRTYIKGENTSTSYNKLNMLQKTSFNGFRFALGALGWIPSSCLELVPLVGTALGFFAKGIPGFGFFNMGLMFLGNYQKELLEIKGVLSKVQPSKAA